jgi:hypothetical protein
VAPSKGSLRLDVAGVWVGYVLETKAMELKKQRERGEREKANDPGLYQPGYKL